MKKLVLVMFSVLFILTGCTSPVKITEDDLLAAGYTDNGAGEYVFFNGNWNVYVTDDGSGQVDQIGVEVYPNIGTTSEVSSINYDQVQLKYDFYTDKWYANCVVGSTHTSLNPNDAYAYINAVVPDAIDELNKLVEKANVSTDDLQGGDKIVVENLLNA